MTIYKIKEEYTNNKTKTVFVLYEKVWFCWLNVGVFYNLTSAELEVKQLLEEEASRNKRNLFESYYSLDKEDFVIKDKTPYLYRPTKNSLYQEPNPPPKNP